MIDQLIKLLLIGLLSCASFSVCIASEEVPRRASVVDESADTTTLTKEQIQNVIKDTYFIEKSHIIEYMTRSPLTAIGLIMTLERAVSDYMKHISAIVNGDSISMMIVSAEWNFETKRNILKTLAIDCPYILRALDQLFLEMKPRTYADSE